MQGQMAEQALTDFEVELGTEVAGNHAGVADREGSRAGRARSRRAKPNYARNDSELSAHKETFARTTWRTDSRDRHFTSLSSS